MLVPHHTTPCGHVVTASKLGQAKMCPASSGDLPGEFSFSSTTGQPEQKQLPASHRQREGLCSVCVDQWLKTQKQGSGKGQVLKGRRKEKGLRNFGRPENSWRFCSFQSMGGLALITQRMKDSNSRRILALIQTELSTSITHTSY